MRPGGAPLFLAPAQGGSFFTGLLTDLLWTEHMRIMHRLDDFLGRYPTLRGRREVLISFAYIVSHFSRG